MRSLTFLLILWVLLFAVSSVRGRQIPVIGGIIGGVPANLSQSSEQSNHTVRCAPTPGKLRVVENSGVCETTPGVYQASGYGDLSATESIWFWFFEARKNADNAPLVLWLNGGPGSSSMIGLLQEHGPCRISNDSKSVHINPTSWNNVANMLYIDQPVGVGFSHGPTTVKTSRQAATDLWQFLQIFFTDKRFCKYKNNKFAIWTESYGGHYGPVFAAEFLEHNAGISAGKLNAIPINLQVLGIGNGLTDPLSQYPGFLTYAAKNPYHPLVSATKISAAENAWSRVGGCRDLITSCYNYQTASTCSNAQSFCNTNILSPLHGAYDEYFVLSLNPDPYPPDLTGYLNNAAFKAKIGAENVWTETNSAVYYNFASTGDWMYNSASVLANVIDYGIKTIIYDGDADYILNSDGVENMVNNLPSKYNLQYRQQFFTAWTVSGQSAGLYKNAGGLSYVRFYGAGHEVPAYTHGKLGYGQAALQMFTQIMSGQPISST